MALGPTPAILPRLCDGHLRAGIEPSIAGEAVNFASGDNPAYRIEPVQEAEMPATMPPSKAREARLFRNNRSQAVHIPAEFELPGERVLIRKEGARLIIEPISGPANILDLLADWKKAAPLGPDDQFPDIEDMPARPEDIF